MANTLVDDRAGAVAEDADFIGAACEIFVIYFTGGAQTDSLNLTKIVFTCISFLPKGIHD